MSRYRTVWIYGLADPRTNQIRYIGKSNRPMARLITHLKDSERETSPKCLWIRELTALSMKPFVVFLEQVTALSWEEREQHWIAITPNLTNVLEGGSGSPTKSEYVRSKISASNKGRKLTHEQVENRRAITTKQWQEGKRNADHLRTPESTEKVRLAMIGWTKRSTIKALQQRSERISKAISKPVEKYTKDGQFVERFDSVKLALQSVGGGDYTTFTMTCAGKYKTYKGFVWKYEAKLNQSPPTI